jgi:hypothetical protein
MEVDYYLYVPLDRKTLYVSMDVTHFLCVSLNMIRCSCVVMSLSSKAVGTSSKICCFCQCRLCHDGVSVVWGGIIDSE